MQEVTLIYPFLSPPSLTAASSSRVCNALNLFRCVAYHVDTKWSFLRANIHLYLYPFIDTTSKGSQCENLRLSSLGVIGALVKVDDPEVISSLLSADIIPVCLRGMEIGGELSQTVATFIVQKIMLNEEGLSYICSTIRQFYLVSDALSRIVQSLAEQEKPSQQLLKHIIYCYHRLADHPRACDTLIGCLPEIFRDPTFCNCIDEETREDFLKPLFYKLHVRSLEWQASSHMNSVIYHM